MRKSAETMERQWALLSCFTKGREYSTTELYEKLKDEYKVSKRTIERDLERLSGHGEGIFPITKMEKGKANYWSWVGHGFELPAMSESSAITLRLVDEYVKLLLPPGIRKSINPYFLRASEVLRGTKLSKWMNKVFIIRRGPEQIMPEIKENIREPVYQALLEDKCLEVSYKKRGSNEISNYEVNPHGMVVKNGIFYIVATFWNYKDIKQLAIHRIQKAKVIDKDINKPKGFSLEEYISEDKEFDYPLGNKKIKIKLAFPEYLIEHLEEQPLSLNQTIKKQKDGRMLLTADVADTDELRWWIRGYGDSVEVVSPKKLRDEFKEMVNNLLSKYR